MSKVRVYHNLADIPGIKLVPFDPTPFPGYKEDRARIEAQIALDEAAKSPDMREREQAKRAEAGQVILNRLHAALGNQGIHNRIEDWASLRKVARKLWRQAGRSAKDFQRVGPQTILWLAETQNRLPKSKFAGGSPALSLTLHPEAILASYYGAQLLKECSRVTVDGRALVAPYDKRHKLVKSHAKDRRETIKADLLRRRGDTASELTTFDLTSDNNKIINQEARKSYRSLQASISTGYLQYDKEDFVQDGYLIARELIIARNGEPIEGALLRSTLQKKFQSKITEMTEKSPDEVSLTAASDEDDKDHHSGGARQSQIEYRALSHFGTATLFDAGLLTADQNAVAGWYMRDPRLSESEIGKKLKFSQSKVSRARDAIRTLLEPPAANLGHLALPLRRASCDSGTADTNAARSQGKDDQSPNAEAPMVADAMVSSGRLGRGGFGGIAPSVTRQVDPPLVIVSNGETIDKEAREAYERKHSRLHGEELSPNPEDALRRIAPIARFFGVNQLCLDDYDRAYEQSILKGDTPEEADKAGECAERATRRKVA